MTPTVDAVANTSEPDPRYPIGTFTRPATISVADRASAIQVLASLPEQLTAAVAGWTDGQLDTPHRQGGWTVRQLVHHIADSHAQASTRLRKALTEDVPTIQPYDEKSWAELPDSMAAPVEASLVLLTGLHARWSMLLRALTPDQWQRTYIHPESGLWSVDSAAQLYSWHSRHHLAHITRLRAAMGW